MGWIRPGCHSVTMQGPSLLFGGEWWGGSKHTQSVVRTAPCCGLVFLFSLETYTVNVRHQNTTSAHMVLQSGMAGGPVTRLPEFSEPTHQMLLPFGLSSLLSPIGDFNSRCVKVMSGSKYVHDAPV